MNDVAFVPPSTKKEVKEVKGKLAAGIGAIFNKGKYSEAGLPNFTDLCITEEGISEDTVASCFVDNSTDPLLTYK